MSDREDHSPVVTTSWHATALDANDNLAIVLESVAAGQEVIVDVAGKAIRVQALEAIALGHKIALADLRPGDRLVKYGETIGEATARIARGAWVHVHNLRSLRARPDARAVAFDAHAYVDVAAAALALSIPAESRDAVAANLTRLSEFAREVLAFDA